MHHGDLSIVFSGPFRTGVFLDFQQLITAGYATHQEKIKRDMKQKFQDSDWGFPSLQSGQIYKSGEDGRGRTLIPRYFIRASKKECSLDLDGLQFSPTIEWIRVRVYEFGFGTISMSVKLKVEGPVSYTAADLGRVADEISDRIEKDEIEELSKYIKEVIESFTYLVSSHSVAQLQALDKGFREGEEFAGIGNIMWTHRLFLYKLHEGSSIGEAVEFMTELLNPPAKFSDIAEGDMRAMEFGVANSVIIFKDDKEADRYCEFASRTLQAANVYTAVSFYLYNSLLWFSNYHAAEVKRFKNNVRQTLELEDDVVRYIQCSAQVISLVSQYEFHLDPRSKEIWDKVKEAWGLQTQLSNIKEQIELCEKLYDRVTNKIIRDQQSRLNEVAIIFTCISALALIEISQRDGLRWPRFDVISALVMVAVVFILFATTLHTIRNAVRKCWKKVIQTIKKLFVK